MALRAARAARRLWRARTAAARFLFEKAFLAGLTPDPDQAYRTTMSRACGLAVPLSDGARHLLEASGLLESADEFRAEILAAQFEAHLRDRFARAWWASPAAGAALRRLWAAGTRDTAEDLAGALGKEGLSARPFLERAGVRIRAAPP